MAKAYLIGAAILIVLISQSIFVVDQREKALKLQLGEIRRSDYQAGLHFKIPIIQDVLKFDARVQNLDSDPELYLTSEKKQVFVDSFVKWKISDVAQYYTSTGGSVTTANQRLQAVILKTLRDEFGKRTVTQVVSGQRADIMSKMADAVKSDTDELGLEIIDVRIKRVDLPDDVSSAVYNRMKAERQEVAKKFRSEGEERARLLRAEADRESEVILANAEREARIIQGDGDARATQIYAEAYGKNAEFYTLYRSLNAYTNTFRSQSDVLLLEPDSEFFRYFNSPNGRQ